MGEKWGERSGVAEKNSARAKNNQKFLQKNFHGRTTILRHLTNGGGPVGVSGAISGVISGLISGVISGEIQGHFWIILLAKSQPMEKTKKIRFLTIFQSALKIVLNVTKFSKILHSKATA